MTASDIYSSGIHFGDYGTRERETKCDSVGAGPCRMATAIWAYETPRGACDFKSGLQESDCEITGHITCHLGEGVQQPLIYRVLYYDVLLRSLESTEYV
jgi:hypothetical protein